MESCTTDRFGAQRSGLLLPVQPPSAIERFVVSASYDRPVAGSGSFSWSDAELRRAQEIVREMSRPLNQKILKMAHEVAAQATAGLRTDIALMARERIAQQAGYSAVVGSALAGQAEQRRAMMHAAMSSVVQQNEQRRSAMEIATQSLGSRIAVQQAAMRAVTEPLHRQIAAMSASANVLSFQQQAVREWMQAFRMPWLEALRIMESTPTLRFGISDEALDAAREVLESTHDEVLEALEGIDELEEPEIADEATLASLLGMLADARDDIDRILWMAFVYVVIFAKAAEFWLTHGGATNALGVLFGFSCHEAAWFSARQAGRVYDRFVGDDGSPANE